MMKQTALILGVATLGGYFVKRYLDNIRAMQNASTLHELQIFMMVRCYKISKSLIDLERKIKWLESFGDFGKSLDMAQFDKTDFAKCGLIKLNQNAEYHARFIAQTALMTKHLQKICEILDTKEKWIDELCKSYSNADLNESQNNADSNESSGESNELSTQTKDEIIAFIAQMQRIHALITEDFAENDKWRESKCVEAEQILKSFGESSKNLSSFAEFNSSESARRFGHSNAIV